MNIKLFYKKIIAGVLSVLMVGTGTGYADNAPAQSPVPQLCEHHSHTELCGGKSGVCTNVCTVCKTEVQNLINSLPSVNSVTDQNKESVKASLAAISQKMEKLTSAAVGELNLTKYNEVTYKVNAPQNCAIVCIKSTASGFGKAVPDVSVAFRLNNALVNVQNASTMISSDKATVKANGNGVYYYIPEGKYALETTVPGGTCTGFTVNGQGAENVNAVKGQLFEIAVTAKGSLLKITKVNTVLSDTSLQEYKATAPSVIAGLPATVNVGLENGADVDLPIEWKCEKYNASPDARNVFVWNAPESALNGKYDAGTITLSGSITVTNAGAIAVLNSANNTDTVYDGNAIDVSVMFEKDLNSGDASYKLNGGTGSGELSGSALTVEKAGTFDIVLTTAANGAYASGEMTATLTVKKAQGTASVSADDFSVGDSSWKPVVSSETNGIDNVEFWYKLKDADDSTYTSVLPTDSGVYTVKAVFAANDLYEEVTATDDFEIRVAKPVANPDKLPASKRSKRRVALSKIEIIPGEILGSNGEVLTGKYEWNEPDKIIVNDGTQKATFTPDNPNYEPIEFDIKVDVYAAYDNSTASGEPTVYTVTFDTNGAKTIKSVKAEHGDRIYEPDAPEKDGYEFDGWYTDKALRNEYNFSTKVTKNFTLYAKWIEVEDDYDDYDDYEEETDEENESEWIENNNCRGVASAECPSCDFYDLDTCEWYHRGVDFVLNNGLMNGTGPDTFEPEGELTRAMLVTILYRVEGQPQVRTGSGFADVASGSYYAKSVAWAKLNGIVNGNDEYTFAPDDYITREQFAAIMYRYAVYNGYDVSLGNDTNILSYDDFFEISNYAVSAMQYAVGAGFMNGKTESTINPQDNATRAEAAAILQRFIAVNN